MLDSRCVKERYKQFVKNRVAEIRELLPLDTWNHIPVKLNPADFASKSFPVSDGEVHEFFSVDECEMDVDMRVNIELRVNECLLRLSGVVDVCRVIRHQQ